MILLFPALARSSLMPSSISGHGVADHLPARWNCESRRIVKMKIFGTAASLLGAIALMLAVIVAQRDYQRSWTAAGIAQASATGAPSPITLERIADATR
jgi:hypothetical protein